MTVCVHVYTIVAWQPTLRNTTRNDYAVVKIGELYHSPFVKLSSSYIDNYYAISLVNKYVWQSQVENEHYSYHFLTTFYDFAFVNRQCRDFKFNRQ